MTVTAAMVKELRQATAAGILDCRKALQESDGDFDKAVDYLREKGIAKAAKRMDRTANEGLVYAYVHGGGRIGVLVEMDFGDKNGGDGDLIKDVAMHIAATNPMCISEADVPSGVLEKEKDILRAQALESGKPAEIVEKMLTGRVRKYLAEITLLGQSFVKDPDKTVETLLSDAGATVNKFVRYEVGEGIDKKQENFADEVAAQVNG